MVARRRAIVACVALSLFAIPTAPAGCARPAPTPSRVEPRPVASADAVAASAEGTAQAQAALEQYFDAYKALDWERYKSLVDERVRGSNLNGLSRVEVGVVRSVAIRVGSGGYGDPDVRRFSASLRLWGPGVVVKEGSVLDWEWELTRQADGRWLVTNMGPGW